MERIYIQEGDNERHGLTQDVSKYIGTGKEIICTIGEGNHFYVNGEIKISDVRIIECGKDFTVFSCWKQGTRYENEVYIEIPTEKVKEIKCAGHYHSQIFKADMSQF